MKIAVIGASGMVGKLLVPELLSRGHQVTGIGRDPAKIEKHDGLTIKAADVMQPDSIASALQGHDVVISVFTPGHQMDLAVYKGMVEAGWRLKRAIKAAGSPYFINVGGVGSLWTDRGVQVMDDPWWPEWYLNTATPAYLDHLYEMTGLEPLRLLAREREAIVASGKDPYADFESEEAKGFVNAMRGNHELAEGCRAQFEIFAEDRTFEWTFLSPPWQLMHGPRTGKYRTVMHMIPLENDVPAGISVADMAIAIADEAEARKFPFEHWSVATDFS